MERRYYTYKVYNEFGGCKDKTKAGMVLERKIIAEDEKETRDTKTVPEVRACLLFYSPLRHVKLAGGKIRCSSHDGVAPSARIAEPLCGKLSAEGLTQILSKWKGFDQTKVRAKVQEATDGAKLILCGLPKADGGAIPLCPYAKKDPDTGAKPACKESLLLKAWDMDHDVEFKMELTGKSMRNDSAAFDNRFVSPFFEFIARCRADDKAIYQYLVTLKPKENDEYWYLDVTDIMPIASEEMVNEMEVRALSARDRHEAAAAKPPAPKKDAQ